MVGRKGKTTSRQIDAEWPYQIALRESVTVGKAHDAVREFCADLSLAPRGHTFFRDDAYWNVWCFAEEEDAEKFRARFGGEFMEPEDRPRWGGARR